MAEMDIITRLILAANTQLNLGNAAAAVALIEQAQLAAVESGDAALAADLFNLYVAAKVKAYG